ncbi:MAG: hypothetical protein H0V70_01900 [Ktedonobacteraceae bacterium]|nr:hypothetical protein [Ktedonobacteraceae bacterium]
MLRRVDRTGAAQAYGVVIVIDVIRAFTVASSIYKASTLTTIRETTLVLLKKN